MHPTGSPVSAFEAITRTNHAFRTFGALPRNSTRAAATGVDRDMDLEAAREIEPFGEHDKEDDDVDMDDLTGDFNKQCLDETASQLIQSDIGHDGPNPFKLIVSRRAPLWSKFSDVLSKIESDSANDHALGRETLDRSRSSQLALPVTTATSGNVQFGTASELGERWSPKFPEFFPEFDKLSQAPTQRQLALQRIFVGDDDPESKTNQSQMAVDAFPDARDSVEEMLNFLEDKLNMVERQSGEWNKKPDSTWRQDMLSDKKREAFRKRKEEVSANVDALHSCWCEGHKTWALWQVPTAVLDDTQEKLMRVSGALRDVAKMRNEPNAFRESQSQIKLISESLEHWRMANWNG